MRIRLSIKAEGFLVEIFGRFRTRLKRFSNRRRFEAPLFTWPSKFSPISDSTSSEQLIMLSFKLEQAIDMRGQFSSAIITSVNAGRSFRWSSEVRDQVGEAASSLFTQRILLRKTTDTRTKHAHQARDSNIKRSWIRRKMIIDYWISNLSLQFQLVCGFKTPAR